MSEESERNADGVDFALVAYREDGVWQVAELGEDRSTDLDDLAVELRRYPGDSGSLGLVSVDEDFFLLVRVLGAQVRLLLSDVLIETTGGQSPIRCHGHHKADATKMKSLIEQYQSDYYRPAEKR